MTTLGEYSDPKYQKKVQKGKYAIIGTSQPGVTRVTLDMKILRNKILCRIRNILKSGNADFVVLATPRHPKCPDAEKTALIGEETAGLSYPNGYPIAPTLLATFKLLQNSEYLDKIILFDDERALSREELLKNATLRVPKGAKIISQTWVDVA